MHLRSLPTMERISVPVRRHPEHYFVVQRSVRLIAIILYQGYNTLKQGLFLIKAVTALLRESHTLNKAVTAVFTSKAAARYKAVIVLRHTTALLRDPYCMVFVNCIFDMVVDTQFHKFHGRPFARVLYVFLMKDIGR